MPDRAPLPRFARVLHETSTHPKFIGDNGAPPLSAVERGTWITALVLADIAFPNAIHESAVRLQAPGSDFDELYRRGLLERCDDPGWFHVHDLDEFRVRLSPSDTPEATRERQRRSRASRAVTRSHERHARHGHTNDTNDTETSIRPDSPDRTQARGTPGRRTKVRGFKGPMDT